MAAKSGGGVRMSGITCDATGCKWNDGDGNCVRDGIYISDRFTKVAMCKRSSLTAKSHPGWQG